MLVIYLWKRIGLGYKNKLMKCCVYTYIYMYMCVYEYSVRQWAGRLR